MKITLNQLRRIIREEVSRVGEAAGYVDDGSGEGRMIPVTSLSYPGYLSTMPLEDALGDEEEFHVVNTNTTQGKGISVVGKFPDLAAAKRALRGMLRNYTTDDELQVYRVPALSDVENAGDLMYGPNAVKAQLRTPQRGTSPSTYRPIPGSGRHRFSDDGL